MDYQQRIRYLALATIIFSVVQHALGTTMTLAPSDVVQKMGENAKFFCKIIADDPSGEATSWDRTLYDGTDEHIYKTYDPKDLNEIKYNFTETVKLETNIVVKNLELQDAGEYRCEAMNARITGKAELVVVNNPIITIEGTLEDGKPGRITCDIYYLRSPNPKAEAIEPEFFASIGTQALSTDITKERSPPVGGDERYKMSLIYNGTMHGSNHGQNFTCGAKVQRNSPTVIDFTISENKELEIKTPTTKAEISEPREMYYPGDSINCTADGFPVPKFQWIQVKSEGAAMINGGMLEITEKMMGNNTWKCKVEQYWNPPVMIVTKEISFQVLSPTEPPTGKSTGADTTTIVIAVVVPVAVILVVLVVVFIVCKKKKSGDAKPKRGETVEAGSASQKPRNQIYKPVATNPEGQVRFQEEKASYRAKDSADRGGRPSPAPRQTEAAEVIDETG